MPLRGAAGRVGQGRARTAPVVGADGAPGQASELDQVGRCEDAEAPRQPVLCGNARGPADPYPDPLAGVGRPRDVLPGAPSATCQQKFTGTATLRVEIPCGHRQPSLMDAFPGFAGRRRMDDSPHRAIAGSLARQPAGCESSGRRPELAGGNRVVMRHLAGGFDAPAWVPRAPVLVASRVMPVSGPCRGD